MRVHHLDCATMCPIAGALVNGQHKLVCHCLLIETSEGLVLVDAGLGMADVRAPQQRLGRSFLWITRPDLDEKATALRQVEALGYKATDVRHIIPTHLDLDHAGGLSDFPWAKVHVFEAEYEAAMARRSLKEKNRYRPLQWAHGPHWTRYRAQGERWLGLECVRALDGLPPEILLVPLIGHTRGHCGVAVQSGGSWMLHAGDAYFYQGEMNLSHPHCTLGLRLFQYLVQIDKAARLRNRDRLRELSAKIRVFCAHDPVEFERERTRTASTV